MSEPEFDQFQRAIAVATGEELRLCREQLGWSREKLLSLLPSGIGQRTLQGIECGHRSVTVPRWVEMCQVMRSSSGVMLDRGVQRAKVALGTALLSVDLHRVADESKLRELVRWANNRLDTTPGGIAVLHAFAVRELAAAIGYDEDMLRSRLADYVPLNISDHVQAVSLPAGSSPLEIRMYRMLDTAVGPRPRTTDPRPPHTWTEAEAQEIRDRYEGGERVATITESTRFETHTVYKILHLLGVKIRGRNSRKPATEPAED